ncbi:MAG: TerC family protein [Cytophagales bacterium]|nr:TerC family protein [Cytophagales bacterium]
MHETLHSIFSLLSLTLMEMALCIDNAIFITILSSRLPTTPQRERMRSLGLVVALVINIAMISIIKLHDSLVLELFTFMGHRVSMQDVILIFGGAFLIANSTIEIHKKMEGDEAERNGHKAEAASFLSVFIKIIFMNVVFSFDSVLTAIALVHEVWKMYIAIFIALFVMYFFIKPIDYFVKHHPTTKILALAFLMLIGLMLIMEGLEEAVDKGYVYFAMAFSIFVEVINISIQKRNTKTVVLHEQHVVDDDDDV